MRIKNVFLKKNNFQLQIKDLDISESTITCILGASGSGKTTLLRTIAGLETAKSQKIELKNKEISHLPPHQRNLGFLFQDYALFPGISVFKNTEYGLLSLKISKKERTQMVLEILTQLQIDSLKDRLPEELSGGEKQRVALARALVRKPEFLLLDEPFSAIDAPLKRNLRELIQTVSERQQIPILFVTHDQVEALSISKYLIVMKDGKILQHGKTDFVYQNPNSIETAKFFQDNSLIPLSKSSTDSSIASSPFGDIKISHSLLSTDCSILCKPWELHRISEKSNFDPPLKGIIKRVEFLGEKNLIFVSSLDNKIEVSFYDQKSSDPTPGEMIQFKITIPSPYLIPESKECL